MLCAAFVVPLQAQSHQERPLPLPAPHGSAHGLTCLPCCCLRAGPKPGAHHVQHSEQGP